VKKFLIFLFVFFTGFNFLSFAKDENKIVVKIENELITSYDVKNKILTSLVLSNSEITQENINKLKRKSLEGLISNRLKRIELSKYSLKKNNVKINSYLNSISSNDINGLKSKFEINNINFEIFLEEVDTEFRWRNLIYNNYSKKINIDPKVIQKEVKKMIKNEKKTIKFNLSEIEIFIENNQLDNEKIILLQKHIKDFGFEDAVSKFSISNTSNNNGNLGWINSNSIANDILKYLNEIEIGEVTKPFKKQGKIIFLKINDKKVSNPSEINIEKMTTELVEKKKNELFDLYSNSLLSKLKNTKFIEYY
tara:strand:+ start:514 stop:1437 length:924 start_codon:yes stop_codon:yes gene_type:complete